MEKNIQWPHIAYVFFLWSAIPYGIVDLCAFNADSTYNWE